jgi:hypothetical protein
MLSALARRASFASIGAASIAATLALPQRWHAPADEPGDRPMSLTTIHGTLHYDIDEDGAFAPQVPGEVPLPGWKVEIQLAPQAPA